MRPQAACFHHQTARRFWIPISSPHVLSPNRRAFPRQQRIWKDIERATIQRVFEQVRGDKALAGRMLGISRATLYRKLKRYNIGMGATEAGASSHTLQ